MPLAQNDPRSIEQYVEGMIFAPVYFPPFTIALKPGGTKWRFHGIYITDTSRPSWMDAAGVWRYADGTLT